MVRESRDDMQGFAGVYSASPTYAAQLRSKKPASDHVVKRFLRRRPWKPGPNHPWRTPSKVFHDRGATESLNSNRLTDGQR